MCPCRRLPSIVPVTRTGPTATSLIHQTWSLGESGLGAWVHARVTRTLRRIQAQASTQACTRPRPSRPRPVRPRRQRPHHSPFPFPLRRLPSLPRRRAVPRWRTSDSGLPRRLRQARGRERSKAPAEHLTQEAFDAFKWSVPTGPPVQRRTESVVTVQPK